MMHLTRQLNAICSIPNQLTHVTIACSLNTTITQIRFYRIAYLVPTSSILSFSKLCSKTKWEIRNRGLASISSDVGRGLPENFDTMGEVAHTGGWRKLSVDDFRDVDWNRLFLEHTVCALCLTLVGEAELIRSKDLSVPLAWASGLTKDPLRHPFATVFAPGTASAWIAMSIRPACWSTLWWTSSPWVDVNWSGVNLTQNYLAIVLLEVRTSKKGIASLIDRWGLRRSLALRYDRTASYPGLPLWPEGTIQPEAYLDPKPYSLMLTINPKQSRDGTFQLL